MDGINLLPWRERRRAERRRDFLAALLFTLLAAAGVLLPARLVLEAWLDGQEARHALLREHGALLDGKHAELRELQARQQALAERLRTLQDLQDGRRPSVELFEALARSVPDGLYYEQVSRRGDRLELEGVARSDAEVAELLRRLEASARFAAPVLQEVRTTAAEGGEAPRRFQLTVRVSQAADSQAGDPATSASRPSQPIADGPVAASVNRASRSPADGQTAFISQSSRSPAGDPALLVDLPPRRPADNPEGPR